MLNLGVILTIVSKHSTVPLTTTKTIKFLPLKNTYYMATTTLHIQIRQGVQLQMLSKSQYRQIWRLHFKIGSDQRECWTAALPDYRVFSPHGGNKYKTLSQFSQPALLVSTPKDMGHFVHMQIRQSIHTHTPLCLHTCTNIDQFEQIRQNHFCLGNQTTITSVITLA